MNSQSPKEKARLIAIDLDSQSIGRSRPDIEHERDVAIFDLLENNHFLLDAGPEGPYRLLLGIIEERLALKVSNEHADLLASHFLSLSPFRRIIKDYFLICESYFDAIRTAPPSRIEAIDMGRRGIHDEGSRILTERLKGKITVDFDTARRLFTLISALHWKG
jgi:uncharacterized protein (UPF0262 family)